MIGQSQSTNVGNLSMKILASQEILEDFAEQTEEKMGVLRRKWALRSREVSENEAKIGSKRR